MNDLTESLKICARQVCPPNCPRYSLPIEGAECARRLMESSADAITALTAKLEQAEAELKFAVDDLKLHGFNYEWKGQNNADGK